MEQKWSLIQLLNQQFDDGKKQKVLSAFDGFNNGEILHNRLRYNTRT